MLVKILGALMLIATSVYAETCNDISSTASCISWKNANWCHMINVYSYCKKTCGRCNGGTRPTNAPPRTYRPPVPATCGKSTVQQGKIVEGVNAQKGAWPWIASLQKNNGHFCGATLLTPKWVVTASHCVETITRNTMSSWTIKLGAHNHGSDMTRGGHLQAMRIKRVIMHPSYSKTSLTADMAMIELHDPAKLDNHVTTACLPQRGVYPPIGKKCFIAGWGSIQHPGRPHHTLQQAQLPVVDSTKCKYNAEVVCVGKGFGSQSNGRQHSNACRGDSGGPLVCQQSDGRWVLEGVASYVYEYCKYYTGYSPVNKYLDWIKSYLRQ